jgi:hypothetical protein
MQTVASGLKKNLPANLIDELLAAYEEAKRNFYVGGLRLSAVEGGRFCEAAFRLLEQITTSKYTPLNKRLDTDKLILMLQTWHPPRIPTRSAFTFPAPCASSMTSETSAMGRTLPMASTPICRTPRLSSRCSIGSRQSLFASITA